MLTVLSGTVNRMTTRSDHEFADKMQNILQERAKRNTAGHAILHIRMRRGDILLRICKRDILQLSKVIEVR